MKKIVEFLGKCKRGITTAAFVVVGALCSFAEGESTGGLAEADLKPAADALKAAKDALSAFVEHNAPVVASVLGAFLVITLIFVVYGWVRRASHGR